MNMVSCGENCRYQIDGCCTRSDLIVNDAGKCSRPAHSERSVTAGNVADAYGNYSDVSESSSCSSCCYFERR